MWTYLSKGLTIDNDCIVNLDGFNWYLFQLQKQQQLDNNKNTKLTTYLFKLPNLQLSNFLIVFSF